MPNNKTKLPSNYVVFDIETTGYSPEKSYILEIGAIKCENGKSKRTFHAYIHPEDDYVPIWITKLTGITYDMVDDAPHFEDVIPAFINFVGDMPVVGHNVRFDIGFVSHFAKCCNESFTPNYKDTLPLSRRVIKDSENYKLETLKKYFNIDLPSHNALDDCKVTKYLYEYIRENI